MDFTPTQFDPGAFEADGTVTLRHPAPAGGTESLYVYDRELVLALNVALAARRPLLLAGEPGSGKTSLARNVALKLGWSFLETTITSRTSAADLVWDFDALARLNAAQQQRPAGAALPDEAFFVRPGPLWWALHPDSAALRGLPAGTPGLQPLPRPGLTGPQPHAVLLVDELDKAEPEVPNDLLEIVDARSFAIRERRVDAPRERRVLMIFCTNGERDFPAAFERRCVVYRFPTARPASWFERVAQRWLPQVAPDTRDAVAARLVQVRADAVRDGRRPPGTAEYLDALRAMHDLGIVYDPTKAADQQAQAWQDLEALVFRKAGAVGTT